MCITGTLQWRAIVLYAYGDESTDEAKQRVSAVAAIVGTDEEWKGLEEKWLTRNNGVPFHAKECDVNPGRGVYANRSHAENKELYKDLALLLSESGLRGIGIALDVQAQKKAFPFAGEYAYYRPLLHTIGYLQFEAESLADIVQITFDSRLESDHNSAYLYATFREDVPGWKEHLAPLISFQSDTDNPRIQVADLFARETMKALDNRIGPVKRPERQSLIALGSTGRFHILAWGEEFYQDMAAKLPLVDKELGVDRETYLAWLAKKKRHHNTTNAFQFLNESTNTASWEAAADKVRRSLG